MRTSVMFPQITYNQENGLAYITFSNKAIEKSIASQDDLFVMDIDKDGALVGIEILSVSRLQKKFAKYSASKNTEFSKEMLPSYLIPFLTSPRIHPPQKARKKSGIA